MKYCGIVAMNKDKLIGHADNIPWYYPEDLKQFKKITMGHPCIMGRITYESIVDKLDKPLPGRTNIVMTRHEDYESDFDNVEIVHSYDDCKQYFDDVEEDLDIFVIGGSQIYNLFWEDIQEFWVTIVDEEIQDTEASVYFQKIFKDEEWNEIEYGINKPQHQDLEFKRYERKGLHS